MARENTKQCNYRLPVGLIERLQKYAEAKGSDQTKEITAFIERGLRVGDLPIHSLKFINSDARPKVQHIVCDTTSIAPVMAWYGAYFAGDRYRVEVDGRAIKKDQNGELAESLADAEKGAK